MSAGKPLSYHVLVSGLLPAAGAPLPDGTRPRWSPLSHTLIHGPAEAALVDPPITVAQATALANWIEAFGKRLAYIYITHWHADRRCGRAARHRAHPHRVLLPAARALPAARQPLHSLAVRHPPAQGPVGVPGMAAR